MNLKEIERLHAQYDQPAVTFDLTRTVVALPAPAGAPKGSWSGHSFQRWLPPTGMKRGAIAAAIVFGIAAAGVGAAKINGWPQTKPSNPSIASASPTPAAMPQQAQMLVAAAPASAVLPSTQTRYDPGVKVMPQVTVTPAEFEHALMAQQRPSAAASSTPIPPASIYASPMKAPVLERRAAQAGGKHLAAPSKPTVSQTAAPAPSPVVAAAVPTPMVQARIVQGKGPEGGLSVPPKLAAKAEPKARIALTHVHVRAARANAPKDHPVETSPTAAPTPPAQAATSNATEIKMF
jgi:hypothetical protein